MRDMVLIGGPFDGAQGPNRYAGRPTLWVYRDRERRGRNGLFISTRSRSGATRYELGDEHGMFRYIVFGLPIVDPQTRLRTMA